MNQHNLCRELSELAGCHGIIIFYTKLRTHSNLEFNYTMKYKAFLLVMVLALSCYGSLAPIHVPAQTMSDVHVLFIISDGFGWSYFSAFDYFDSWGVQTTTVALALDTTVAACHNRPYRETTADMLLQHFDMNTLSDYNCVFVPAGGNWPTLSTSLTVEELMTTAYAQGLLVATFCIGNVVVAGAGSLCAGTKVASFSMSNDEMLAAGANIVENVRVVSDNRIITGSQGGGPTGGGYDAAPIYEVCAMVVKLSLGYSTAQSIQVTPSGTDYSVSVTTTDPASTLPGINSTTITEVRARVYAPADPISPVTTVNLAGSADTYTGTISGLTGGPYRVDIEIKDTDQVLEVIRDASTVFPSFPLVIGGIVVGIVGIIAVVSVIYWRRRSTPS
jgi:putative intracellular protease/amidase